MSYNSAMHSAPSTSAIYAVPPMSMQQQWQQMQSQQMQWQQMQWQQWQWQQEQERLHADWLMQQQRHQSKGRTRKK